MSATGRKIEKDFNVNNILKLLEQTHGNIYATAKALNVSRCTLYAYIKNHPELTEILKDERQALIDKAESKIWGLVDDEDSKIALDATKFILERLGKDRGYVTRQETDIVSGAIPAVLTEEMIVEDDE